MNEKEMMEKYELMEEEWDAAAWHDTCDQEEEDDYWWEEPSWDLDMGFDPYEGLYTDDC